MQEKELVQEKAMEETVTKADESSNVEQEGEEGKSVIKPEYCFFRYGQRNRSVGKALSLPKNNKRKRNNSERFNRSNMNTVDEDIEAIIEIMSSPEKSPTPKVHIISDSSPEKAKTSRKVIPSPDKAHVKRRIISSDDTGNSDTSDVSLPSLDENPSSEAPKTNENQQFSFKDYPGKLCLDLYESFSSLNRGLNIQEIFQVLFHPDKYPICQSVPQYVQTPSAFLLDKENLSDLKDVRADSNGVWKIMNKPKRTYQINSKGEVKMLGKGLCETDNAIYHVTRSYSCHKYTPSFRRLIIEISDCPFLILQYYFNGKTVPVTVKPHGNSKQQTAYRRVAKSTLDLIRDISKNKKESSKSVVKSVVDSIGGIEECETNKLPRNEQQVKNLRRGVTKDHAQDEIEELLHAFDSQKDNFIRKVDIRPDFIVVLATDQQINDINRFCVQNSLSALGIDPTFHFGDFDVTITTYKHVLLQESDKKSPVFVGPICIHKKKEASTYYNFFSTLISKNNALRDIKAVGTDGEHALCNAILMAFENTVNLRCFNHMYRNISNKLKDMGVSKVNKNMILSDIFGNENYPQIKIAGLVDSLTNTEFDIKLESLHEKWDTIIPGFWKWFHRYEGDTFKNCMIQSVRRKAGMSNHEKYTTNDNESINSAMQRVCGKHQSIMKFVDEVKSYVESQDNQLVMAVVQQGNYLLKQEFKNLEIALEQWSNMSKEDRHKHLAKVRRFIPTSLPDKFHENTSASSASISASVDNCRITDVPQYVLEDMWSKASTLLQTKFAINEIPNLLSTRRVISLSNPRDSHMVDFNQTSGRIACDCHLYKLHKICHHAVVVGEEIRILERYLKWRRQLKSPYSLQARVNMPLPASAGRKPNDKVWKKKAKSNVNSTVEYVDNFNTDTEDAYIFRFLKNTKIMSCYGCGKKFRQTTAVVPPVPKDIVLARKEYRKYFDGLGHLKLSLKKEFVHYHIDENCVKSKDDEFSPQSIIITDMVRGDLQEGHKRLIAEKFQIFV